MRVEKPTINPRLKYEIRAAHAARRLRPGEKLNPNDFETPRSFPSPELLSQIGLLQLGNTPPTRLSGMTPEGIVDFASIGGRTAENPIVINVRKTSPTERKTIKDAAKMRPKIIIVLGDKDSDEQAGKEKRALRELTYQTIINPSAREAFETFIGNIFTIYPNSVLDNWNQFIVEHEGSRNAINAKNTHHYHNIEVRKESEGDDPLRDEAIILVQETMRSVINQARKYFDNETRLSHKHIQDFDEFSLAIGMNYLSHFIRAELYRQHVDSWDPEDPRILALSSINRLNQTA